ncbi:MAG: serine hydrolase [Coriobacteriales bacterium]|jgi:CubicO group peptidase (beta-lactamase class C family)|nr:serine hydrolase [Coriobacteriales bacterium]
MIDQSILTGIADDALRRLHLPSLCVGAALAGEEYLYAKGHRAFLVKAANQDTVYRLASCSKSFIATAILLLQEQGLLSIDAPVVRYLPEFRMYTDELTAQVTARDMLSHRTGLPRHDIATFANQQRSLAQMAQSVRYLEPAYALRERFHYQNQMYGVLSLLIERLSGQAWDAFVQERILNPLDMRRTYTRCGIQRSANDNYARPLLRLGSVNVPYINSNDDSTGGAGALSASIGDLLTWAKVNLSAGKLQGKAIFPAQLFTQLHQAQTPILKGEMTEEALPFITDTAYALGWYTERFRGDRLVYHGGTIFGFKAMVGFLLEHDFAFAILVNQDSTVACEAIAYTLCDAVLGASHYDWVSQCGQARAVVTAKRKLEIQQLTAAPREAPSLAGLAGSYQHPAYGLITVRQHLGKLTLQIANMNLTLKPSRLAEFALHSKLAGTAFPCYFERPDGLVTALCIKLDTDLDSFIRFELVGHED